MPVPRSRSLTASLLIAFLASVPGGSLAEETFWLDRKFRTLEALYFVPLTAFPAGQLHTIYPGDVIDIERTERVQGYSQERQVNDCLPGLAFREPEPLEVGRHVLDADLDKEFRAEAGIGPGGLFTLGGKATGELSSTATFEVFELEQTVPDGGEDDLSKVSPDETCWRYHQVLGGPSRNFVIVLRALSGREEFQASIKMKDGGAVGVEASEILQWVGRALGLRSMPVDALEWSRDHQTAEVALIRKPHQGKAALGFVPMHLNKEEVARIHFFVRGEEGVELRNMVIEALQVPEPGLLEDYRDRFRDFFGLELEDEQWARRFLTAEEGAEPGTMQPTASVIEELEREIPGVMTSIALYAAAVELSGGSSGLENLVDGTEDGTAPE